MATHRRSQSHTVSAPALALAVALVLATPTAPGSGTATADTTGDTESGASDLRVVRYGLVVLAGRRDEKTGDWTYHEAGQGALYRSSFVVTSEAERRPVILRGWLVPPEPGEYRFFITAPVDAELWLSTDRDTANKRLVIMDDGRAGRSRLHVSTKLELLKGVPYYLEARFAPASAGQTVSVLWEGPGQQRAVIDGRFFVAEFGGSGTK